MGKRKSPATSNEAYHSLDPNQLAGLRKRIFQALQSIGTGHYEDIAIAAGIEPVQCWKRLSELHSDGIIHRTGERKMLSSNRMGFVWAPGSPPETVKKKERVLKGKTVADFSKAILDQPTPSPKIQQTLF
jgi:hypothetical protein